MLWSILAQARHKLRSERGVSAAEYAVMAVGLVALVAVCGSMVAAWFVPTLAAVTVAV